MKAVPKKPLLSLLPHVFNGLVLAFIHFYGIWFASDGHYPRFHSLENYYVNFSQALQKGQVALLDQPDPRLTSLAARKAALLVLPLAVCALILEF